MYKKLIQLLFIFIIISCDKHEEKYVYVNSKVDTILKSSSDTPVFIFSKLIDTALTKNIRMVEYKFKVSDVLKATSDITELVKSRGGYVSRDHLKSKISKITEIQVSQDTSVLSTYYDLSNTIVLRVPNSELDSMIIDLSNQIDFIDFRFLYSNDKVMERLSTKIGKKNYMGESNGAIIIGSQTEKNSSEDEFENPFSAIVISMYQNPSVRTEYIQPEKKRESYEDSFENRFNQSTVKSMHLFESMIVFVVGNWPYVLLLIILFICVLLLRKTSKV